MRCRLLFLLAACLLAIPARAAQDLPKMKFNDVKEIAPGVFFRYSAISPTDDVVFGGCNNIWVVFEDFVVVIDANFPKEAADVIAAVKKTTDKPIRYVFDTHHHGDHAYGNAVFARAGASVISQTNCARWLREKGAQEFKEAGSGATGRPDIRASTLKVPNVLFDDLFVLEDSKQRIEFRFFGHAHTPGDASAYLPRHKILCTGDACVNGAFNYMGHSDSASWIRALERMQQLDIAIMCPGHGPLAHKDLLERQKRYFVELRSQVQKGIDANKDFADIEKSIDMPWYKEWTTVEARSRKENIEHVYGELTGRIAPWDLAEDFGILEGPSPTKSSPGWKAPRRIVVPNLMPARLAELKRVAPEIEFITAKTAEDAARLATDADAVVGFCTPEIVRAGKDLRWIQVGHAGVEEALFPELTQSKLVLTNLQRVHGPNVADGAMALLLALTRGIHTERSATSGQWDRLRGESKPQELHDKTLLVVGLGGIGTQVARRANACGLRVRAIDPKEMDRPAFVFSLDRPTKLLDLLPEADAVVLCCPLTAETKGLVGAEQLKTMKKTAYLINVSRGPVVQTAALIDALKNKQIAGAGLDVVDPEPLPDDSPLWQMRNVVITPHNAGQTPEAVERQWRLYRENVRRFVAGEPLLCVVDKAKGY